MDALGIVLPLVVVMAGLMVVLAGVRRARGRPRRKADGGGIPVSTAAGAADCDAGTSGSCDGGGGGD